MKIRNNGLARLWNYIGQSMEYLLCWSNTKWPGEIDTQFTENHSRYVRWVFCFLLLLEIEFIFCKVKYINICVYHKIAVVRMLLEVSRVFFLRSGYLVIKCTTCLQTVLFFIQLFVLCQCIPQLCNLEISQQVKLVWNNCHRMECGNIFKIENFNYVYCLTFSLSNGKSETWKNFNFFFFLLIFQSFFFSFIYWGIHNNVITLNIA